ncbi:MAG: hypothetical protein M1834_005049 [Cirrosporium novae-zelandiae]|nr:MAG: hypothetical protein M1834_005049 [Cirrosporium novae-zelandiae]
MPKVLGVSVMIIQSIIYEMHIDKSQGPKPQNTLQNKPPFLDPSPLPRHHEPQKNQLTLEKSLGDNVDLLESSNHYTQLRDTPNRPRKKRRIETTTTPLKSNTPPKSPQNNEVVVVIDESQDGDALPDGRHTERQRSRASSRCTGQARGSSRFPGSVSRQRSLNAIMSTTNSKRKNGSAFTSSSTPMPLPMTISSAYSEQFKDTDLKAKQMGSPESPHGRVMQVSKVLVTDARPGRDLRDSGNIVSKARTSDGRSESDPDELQASELTISSHSRVTHRSSVKSSDNHQSRPSHIFSSHLDTLRGQSLRSEPSNIFPTEFKPRKGSEAKLANNVKPKKPEDKGMKTWPLVYYQRGKYMKSLSTDDQPFILFDSSSGQFHLSISANRSRHPEANINISHIHQIKFSSHSGKLQIQTTKTNASEKAHIELGSPGASNEVIKTIQAHSPDIRVDEIESDKLDKIFAKQASQHYEEGRLNSFDGDDIDEIAVLKQANHVIERNYQADTYRDLGSRGGKPKLRERLGDRGIELSSIKPSTKPTSSQPTIISAQDRENATSAFKHTGLPQHNTRSRTLTTATAQTYLNNSHNDSDLTYPTQGQRRATVDFQDLLRLNEDEFLNDNLINFYIRYLEEQVKIKNPELSKRMYFFNSFFFASLTTGSKDRNGINYSTVSKWTRTVEIFDKDYVIVPVNENYHWYLAIICNLPRIKRKLAAETNTPSESPGKIDLEEGSGELSPDTLKEHLSPIAGRPAGQTRDDIRDKIEDTQERNTQDVEKLTLEDDNAPIIVSEDSAPLKNTIDTDDNGKMTRALQIQQKAKDQTPMKKRFDPKTPTIITMDSLHLPHSSTTRALKEYLKAEGLDKRALEIDINEIKGLNAKSIPKQSNYSDCGVFLIAYLERFTKNPHEFVQQVTATMPLAEVEKQWKMDSIERREHILELIQGLYHEQHPRSAKKIPRSLRSAKANDQPELSSPTNSQGSIVKPTAEDSKVSTSTHLDSPSSAQGPKKVPAAEQPDIRPKTTTNGLGTANAIPNKAQKRKLEATDDYEPVQKQQKFSSNSQEQSHYFQQPASLRRSPMRKKQGRSPEAITNRIPREKGGKDKVTKGKSPRLRQVIDLDSQDSRHHKPLQQPDNDPTGPLLRGLEEAAAASNDTVNELKAAGETTSEKEPVIQVLGSQPLEQSQPSDRKLERPRKLAHTKETTHHESMVDELMLLGSNEGKIYSLSS